MEVWGWIAGYVLLFALLHLALYYYYVRRDTEGSSSPPSFTDRDYAGARSAARPDRVSGRNEEGDAVDSAHRFPAADTNEVDADRNIDPGYDGETVRCHHCGVRNVADQSYTFCWNCISTLRQ